MWAFSIGLSLGGAWLADLIGWPLPWLIGPMLGMIFMRCVAGVLLPDVPGGRRFGQWIIATAIGLHFTPAVVHEVIANWFVIFLAAALTLSAAAVGMVCLLRSGCDSATAFFASLPGGASEMVNMAIQHQARVDQVAAAHSLRIVSVVLLVPPVFTWVLPTTMPVTVLPVLWPQLFFVLALGAVTALVWRHFKQPNPWMLGPLFSAALYVAVTGTEMSMPTELSKIAQLFIGLSLGSYFDRAFIKSAVRFLSWVSLFIVLSMLCCAALAWVLAWGSQLSTGALILGMAPGGITELSITAEALHIPVALVAAIQVLRLVFVMFLASPVFNYWIKDR